MLHWRMYQPCCPDGVLGMVSASPYTKHNAAAKKDVNMLSVMVMEYVYKGEETLHPWRMYNDYKPT